MTGLQPHYVIDSSGQKRATEGATCCMGGSRISEEGFICINVWGFAFMSLTHFS